MIPLALLLPPSSCFLRLLTTQGHSVTKGCQSDSLQAPSGASHTYNLNQHLMEVDTVKLDCVAFSQTLLDLHTNMNCQLSYPTFR